MLLGQLMGTEGGPRQSDPPTNSRRSYRQDKQTRDCSCGGRGGLETGAGYVGALRCPARETGGTFAVGAFHGRILGP